MRTFEFPQEVKDYIWSLGSGDKLQILLEDNTTVEAKFIKVDEIPFKMPDHWYDATCISVDDGDEFPSFYSIFVIKGIRILKHSNTGRTDSGLPF